MPTYTEIHDRDVELVNDWFKGHKATLQVFEQADPKFLDTITKIIWAKPGTGINRIIYLIHNNTMFVSGDLGDAVYQWSCKLTPEFLANCGLGYFGGKCQASSEEPRGKTWEPDLCRLHIEEKLQQWAADNPLPCRKCCNIAYVPPTEEDPDDPCPGCNGDEVVSRPPLTFEQCQELMYDEDIERLEEVISHPHAWARFIYESDGLIVSDQRVKKERDRLARVRVLLDDEEEYPRYRFEPSDEASVGYTWDLRTRGHLVGLKRAFKQLKASGSV